MKRNNYNGNDVGEYPVTVAEKVAVPSMRKRLADLLDEIVAVTEAAPVKVEASDITALTKEQLDSLKVGDVVAKVTGNQKHLYLVSYKGEGSGEGICLSYNAAGYGETVSYDRTESGWSYNSTDVKEYGGGGSQVQSDWNQTDDTKPDYIKNKPNISGGGLPVIYAQSDSSGWVWAYNNGDVVTNKSDVLQRTGLSEEDLDAIIAGEKNVSVLVLDDDGDILVYITTGFYRYNPIYCQYWGIPMLYSGSGDCYRVGLEYNSSTQQYTLYGIGSGPYEP